MRMCKQTRQMMMMMMMAPQIRLTDDPSDGSVSGDAATRLILVLVQRIPPADPLLTRTA